MSLVCACSDVVPKSHPLDYLPQGFTQCLFLEMFLPGEETCETIMTTRKQCIPLWKTWEFSSVQSLGHVWLCNPMDCSKPGFPVHHQPPDLAQTHVHWVSDAIQPSHILSSPSAFNLSQNQGLFQCVSFPHKVAKVLECQLQHQSFQWIFRTDFL